MAYAAESPDWTNMRTVQLSFVCVILTGSVAVDPLLVQQKPPPTLSDCTGPDVFMCDQKDCIPNQLKCNGVNDCTNGLDEDIATCGCLSTEFQCNSTTCIDLIRRCDRTEDCSDGLDEKDCITYACPPTHGKCKNHYCVPRDNFCDIEDNCGDNSDEVNCAYPECYATQFECRNKQCVNLDLLCDGFKDCFDGSDEENCDRYHRCGSGFYRYQSSVCDGFQDCADQSDESNCTESCDDGFRCRNGRCLGKANHCDWFCDCGESCEDEMDCGASVCRLGESFPCKLLYELRVERCIDNQYLCDGHNDCYNNERGSDEMFCLNKLQQGYNATNLDCRDFGRDYFPCPEGRCIPRKSLCDYFIDCQNGEDEDTKMCEKFFRRCTEAEFRCKNSQCVNASLRCDGRADCFDGSDEEECDKISCPPGYRRCKSGPCIPEVQWCDYFRDCPDVSDETDCVRQACNHNEFTCNNGQCIDSKFVCYKPADRRKGCADESNLYLNQCKKSNCSSGQFKCRNSYCIDEAVVCDITIDCPLNSYWDELGCPLPCPYLSRECVCRTDEIDCRGKGLKQLPADLPQEHNVAKFFLSDNFLNNSLDNTSFLIYSKVVYLDLGNNSLKQIPVGMFRNLFRLVSLNLENNKLSELEEGSFIGLYNLRSLYLRGNQIQEIFPYALTGLSKLLTLDLSGQQLRSLYKLGFVGLRSVSRLDLSGNRIEYVYGGSFSGLDSLLTLDLSDNRISFIDGNAFSGLAKLSRLEVDEFRFCCLARDVQQCLPEPDEFSSCEDLMSNYLLRITIWILGTVAFFGNLLVFIWRVRDDRNGKVHSFLITNLAVGDFFMGVYLLIIAVVDSYYRGEYIIFDRSWRKSELCKFAGFISTFSSELSVFTLTVITLDRLICIIFPLKLKRLGIKQASVVMPCIWIVVIVLSGIPLFGLDYFDNFYGRSGVCLAFHITPDKPKGWEYSVFVFLVLNFLSFLVIFISYLWMFLVAKQTTTAVRKSKAKSDNSMAKRMTLIVMSDFFCWVPIILLGFASLGGATVPPQVYAWVAVFVLPLNSAMNPVLYTISTAPFMRNIRKRASRFRKSFTGSSRNNDTKNSFIENSSQIWNRNSMYRQLELTRLRGLKKTYTNHHDKATSRLAS